MGKLFVRNFSEKSDNSVFFYFFVEGKCNCSSETEQEPAVKTVNTGKSIWATNLPFLFAVCFIQICYDLHFVDNEK